MRLVISLLAAANFLLAQPDPALWRFVHPDAKAVIGIDWKQIYHSQASAIMHEKLQDLPIPVPGIQFLNDVERVILSSPGNKDPNSQSEPPVLICVRGHFNQEEVGKALADTGAKRQMYGDVPVYRPQSKSDRDMAFALLDERTILIGDAHSIFEGIERKEWKPASASAIVSRAINLESAYDFWAVITTPGALANQKVMSMFPGSELAEEAEGFELGVSLKDGMSLNLGLDTRTEDGAKKLSAQISKALKLSAKDKPENPVVADLQKKMKIAVEKRSISMTLHLSKEEFEKSARLFDESRKKTQATASSAADPAVQLRLLRPQPKPEKQVIRIDGLDDGPREVPLKP